MKAEDKKILYTFFQTASDYLSGFKTYEDPPFIIDDLFVTDTIFPSQVNSFTGEADIEKPAYKNFVGVDASAVYNLKKIYEQISSCKSCRLCEKRHNTVAGEGPFEFSNFKNKIEVMVIGEGPGADEDAQGRPFVGKAGQLLDKMLAAINLFRTHNCYITNVVKCRPPNNRDPLPDETSACRNFLNAQIDLIKPKALLVVGRVALQNLLETTDGIGKSHGKFFEYKNIPLMATYHPSALLRDVNLKRPAWEDLKLFRSRLNELTQNN